jgi:uncharacterized membrane protein YidH (DUF202 family)
VLCGGLLILAFIKKRKRAGRDAVALVIGAVVLTGTGIAIALFSESLDVSPFVRQWLGLVVFLIAGLTVYGLLNRRMKSASLR